MKICLILLICLLYWGCYSSSYLQEATHSAFNQRVLEDKILNFITPGGHEYQLVIERMDSLSLEGSGRIKKDEDAKWEKFSGEIPLDSIDLLSFSQSDPGKSFLINSVVLTLLIKGFMADDGPDNPQVELVYPRGSGSCPFIYSWNGNDFILEGEAFPIALGKAREMTNRTVLSQLNPVDNMLKVRITNERPETHFFNQITLQAVEVDDQAFVVSDNNRHLWPVYQNHKPISATNNTGQNILDKISQVDNIYWQSDLSNLSVDSQYQDQIYLTFNRPQDASSGSLVIQAINTQFGNYVFENLFSFLGDQSLAFMQAIENDRDFIQLCDDWTREGTLSVAYWDGLSWQSCGTIDIDANATSFSRLLRVNIPSTAGESVKFKLSSLADVWKIDAVGLDWTEVERLETFEIPLGSPGGKLSSENRYLIENNDHHYTVLLPSEHIDLNYEYIPTSKGEKVCFALDATGYLYEGLPNKNSSSLFAGFGNMYNHNRIEFVKYLLTHKNILLPPLYTEWARYKSEKRPF